MKIPYRDLEEYLDVDIDALRPKGSYKKLIQKRTHSIDHLIKEYGNIPDELLSHRNCPTCNYDKTKQVLRKDHFDIVSCKNCNLIYTNPIFNEAHYKETYQSKDYQEIVKGLGEESHNYRVNRFGKERVDILSKFLPENKKIKYLDIGCSTGFVVEAAKNIGWEAIGIDLNPSAINFGRDRGLDLRNNSLDEISFNKKSFDIISLFDVLEHLPDPTDIINQALGYLKKGGILFIYVPNWDSASRILLGEDAHFIWPTHHLNYYTPNTICDFLDRFGLEVEYLITEGLDMIDYIWHQQEIKNKNVDEIKAIVNELQFFVNAGGYGKNLRVIARK